MNLKQQTLKDFFIQATQDYETNLCTARHIAVVSAKEALYISKEAAEVLSQSPSKVKKIVMRNFLSLKKRAKGEINYSVELTKDGRFLKTISIYSSLNEKKDAKLSLEDKILKIRDFDISISRLVSGVTYSRNRFYYEAFSALMHVKRFGNSGGFLRNMAYENAQHAVCGNPEFYTSHSLFAVDKLSRAIDIEKTPHKDLVVYAGVIASLYQLEESQLKEIKKAYALPRAIYKMTGSLPLKLIAKTMLKNKTNEEVYRAGRIIINSHEWCLKDEKTFWKQTFASMEAHERTTGFVFNPIDALDKKLGSNSAQVMIDKKSRHRSHLTLGKSM